jgi:radical SAM superfamily enzyme YgiQ (UPF0313 family)
MNIPIIVPPAPYLTNPKALMPLGVLYIAGYIESKGDVCTVIDLSGVDNYIEYTIDKLKQIDFTYVGISATSGQACYSLALASEIRKTFPKVKIIGGGPHFTHTCLAHKRIPTRTQKFVDDFNSHFDVYVLGDGEKAIYEAISSDKKVIDATTPISPSFISDDDLSNIPYPARHLIDMDSYVYNLGCKTASYKKAISIISQRGCPYGCRFCCSRVDKFSRIPRKTSVHNTLGEIEHLFTAYGYTDFCFYDDELNVNNQLDVLLNGFKDLQMKVGTELRFRAFLKSNLVSRDQMKKLKEAGMTVAVIGGESGSERILKNINKKSTLEQNTRFVEYAKEFGVHPKCIMSIGHPGESNQTLEDTFSWLQKVQLADVNFTIISCLPSSHYYDYAKLENGLWVYSVPENGDKLYSVDVDFHAKPNILSTNLEYGYESTVFTDHLTQEEIVEWHKKFELYFKG